ncbi:MAG TPA: DotH/IcmK family type IV secretion protein, partial [Micavibrio sp.]
MKKCGAGLAFGVTFIFAIMVLAGIPFSKLHAQETGGPSAAAALAPDNASSDAGADSALPDGGTLMPRSPGLELPIAGAPGVPAQKTKEEVDAEIRQDAFNAALTGLLPLEPNEIRKVLKRFDETQEASETPIYPYPEPEVVVKNVSLDPGVMPPLIKVAVGHVTTMNLLDISGAPWPIQDVTWAGNFEIVQPEEGGHVIRITPMSEFAYGNMSVRLVDLKTPITFILRTHRDGVYYRVDARLPQYGPQATPPLIDGGITIAAGNPTMTAVLDGMPPQDAKKMDVVGVDGRTTAFKYNDMMYVRTPLTLLSPAWTGSVKSADGTNVYTLA